MKSLRIIILLAMAWMSASGIPAAESLFETTCVFAMTPNNKPNYRIPAILQAPNGDILIFAEKRNDGPGDIGNHDIVLKRSRDKGRTWSDEQVIFDDGNNVCTDITVGIDRSSAKIWLFFLRDKKKFAYFTSVNSGATWQGPVSIHEQVTKPEWDKLESKKSEPDADPSSGGRGVVWAKGWVQRYGVGPGNAVVQIRSGAKAGRLVVPARHREDIGGGRLRSFAHCFYSDDHGATWKLGGTIGLNTSECQFVELANGDLRVMSRDESSEDAPDNLRHLTAISHDGGETWVDLRRAEELITPRCHGPVERLTLVAEHDKNRLLFSSPASPFRQNEHPYGRYNLTIRLSYDEGETWTAGKTIWPHPASYSDMVVLDDRTVGYVYERGEKGSTHYWDEVHFARFNLEWLTDGHDSINAAAHGEMRMGSIISDHMILQSGVPAPVWGWAAPGENVSVSIDSQIKTTTADARGRWSLKLDKLEAGAQPRTLTVRGRSTITIHDVLVGEVWLCSGQSNMEMQVKGGMHGQVDHADEEIAAAKYPGIRMFLFQQTYNIYDVPTPPDEPMADRAGEWIVCSPETVARFSATAYFFGRDLHRELGTPIGLINASVGGTPIEAWTSLEAQRAEPALSPVIEEWQQKLAGYDAEDEQRKFLEAKAAWLKQRAAAQKAGEPPPKAPLPFKNQRVMAPGGLFNGMIAPLVPYAIRGVIWYQGERNADGQHGSFYGAQLKTLIRDWRARWTDEFYFAWVQLPRIKAEQRLPSEPNGWGVSVRDEMRRTLSEPRTGMAITIDLGGVTAGHPTNKADFARRLSLLALHDVYGKSMVAWSGPVFKSAQAEGNKMQITFDHAAGLKPASGELKGFAIAGADQKFVWADARVTDGKVIVWSDKVSEPMAVRYGWSSNPIGNLVNAADLPASPFRTDDWN